MRSIGSTLQLAIAKLRRLGFQLSMRLILVFLFGLLRVTLERATKPELFDAAKDSLQGQDLKDVSAMSVEELSLEYKKLLGRY